MSKILIVEDEKLLSEAFRIKLQTVGFQVKVARDGEEAIAALAGYTPDLILLDLIMPRKDGFTVLSELKSNPKWRSIPVLIASNLSQREDIDRGMSLGAADFLVKTEMSLDDLVKKIKTLLK